MSTVTAEELQRRRAFRKAWTEQRGRCRDCGCELGADAQLDGLRYAGEWLFEELRCVTCAGQEVVWEVEVELARDAAANGPLDDGRQFRLRRGADT